MSAFTHFFGLKINETKLRMAGYHVHKPEQVIIHTVIWSPITIDIDTEGSCKYLGASYNIDGSGIDSKQLLLTSTRKLLSFATNRFLVRS